MNSSGQARIHFRQNRYLVSYESADQKKKGTWLVGFQLPQSGQEVLRILYGQRPRRVSGPFFKRLFVTARKQGDKELKKLQGFISFLSELPPLLHQAQKEKLNCSGKSCQTKLGTSTYHINLDEQQNLHVRQGRFHMWGSNSHENGDWYQKLEMSHQLKESSGPQSKTSSLILFIKNCR